MNEADGWMQCLHCGGIDSHKPDCGAPAATDLTDRQRERALLYAVSKATEADCGDPLLHPDAILRALRNEGFDVARLAAPAASEPGLDVERLARALEAEAHNLYAVGDAQRRDMAGAIAAEYARLASEPTDE